MRLTVYSLTVEVQQSQHRHFSRYEQDRPGRLARKLRIPPSHGVWHSTDQNDRIASKRGVFSEILPIDFDPSALLGIVIAIKHVSAVIVDRYFFHQQSRRKTWITF